MPFWDTRDLVVREPDGQRASQTLRHRHRPLPGASGAESRVESARRVTPAHLEHGLVRANRRDRGEVASDTLNLWWIYTRKHLSVERVRLWDRVHKRQRFQRFESRAALADGTGTAGWEEVDRSLLAPTCRRSLIA